MERFSIAETEEQLRANFGFEPTPSQDILLNALARFVVSEKVRCVLAIKGYAGTGKTTMVNSLVKTLNAMNMPQVLMAPTGRAAKVLANYTGSLASTIHRRIYTQRRTRDGRTFFALAPNIHRNAVFVVDEASMVGWDTYTGPMGGNLLQDLFEYVFNGTNCRLILIGDGAQLPPVGSAISPALDVSFLKSHFDITTAACELVHVTRQKAGSGILELATAIRDAISVQNVRSVLPFKAPVLPDVRRISGLDLQDYLESAFAKYGAEGVTIITRSNKRANLFNQEIRNRVYFRDERVSAGDLLMSVKNNYHWLGPNSKAGFIANGDVMEVLRLGKSKTMYGFDFANATVRLIDYPDEPELDVMLWINTIDSEGPAMPSEAWNELYKGVLETYSHIEDKEERKKAINSDPFYNALQVKFAYAVTCHKAQGGQWPVVFVDQGYVTEEMLDVEYLRWLYTAVTRASVQLYLLNFSDLIITE